MADCDATKLCNECKEVFPLSSFSSAGYGGRLRGKCKKCTAEIQKSQLDDRRKADGPLPATRICSKCGEEKCLSKEFFKASKSGSFGFTTECKKCLETRNAIWRKTENGRLLDKRHREKNKDKTKQRWQIYQKKNRERLNKYVAEWREKNREHVRKVDAAWARRNKDKRTVYRHERRAAGVMDYAVITGLREKQKNKCPICKKKLVGPVEIDHIFPVSLGGNNNIFNLQLLCRKCNRSKGAKHPIDYMQSKGFLL